MPLGLIIEDDAPQAKMVGAVLRTEGYQTILASTGEEGLTLCAMQMPELILLDLGLPDADGLDLIPELLKTAPICRIVVLTGEDSVSVAVEALRAGARHYLVKPWDRNELLLVLQRESRTVNHMEVARRRKSALFWGTHPAMQRLRDQLEKIARSPNTSVLIEGDTGTGKEILSQELHRLTDAKGPFVALNCAAVPESLMESELFGHERGSFTGAGSRHRGLVEIAKDGTLLLDEIGEMDLSLQAKFLRFLQDHRFRRVGGEQEFFSSCRIVAASNRDLEELQTNGGFRSDLYFRLAVVRLKIPSLRERQEDILPLCYFLLETVSKTLGRPMKQMNQAAEAAIAQHDWPGNIRELRNRLERALVLGDDPQIMPVDLGFVSDVPCEKITSVHCHDPRLLKEVLDSHGWNISRSARELGVPRHWLRYRIQKHGLKNQAK